MSSLNQSIKQLPILLKREFWEHKVAIFYVPMLIAAFSISIVILTAISSPFLSMHVSVDDKSEFGGSHAITIDSSDTSMSELIGPQLLEFSERSMSYKERFFEKFFTTTSMFFIGTLWFVVFFYLQGTLYEDRKDRSVLFWKSMPVSDGITVASKLIMALIVIPIIYLVFIAISHLGFLIVASIVAASNSVSVGATIWEPAGLVFRWISMLAFFGFNALWCLPFYAWILFVSSWAKSVPFAWVVGVPFVLVAIETMLFRQSDYIKNFIGHHVLSFQEISRGFSAFSPSSTLALELLFAVGLGAVFIGLTVWKRGFANEI